MEPWELLGFAPPPSRRAAAAAAAAAKSSYASPSASASAPAPAAGGAEGPKKYVSNLYVELAEGEDIWSERVTPQQRALWLSGFGPSK
jgi:hypothetical protein